LELASAYFCAYAVRIGCHGRRRCVTAAPSPATSAATCQAAACTATAAAGAAATGSHASHNLRAPSHVPAFMVSPGRLLAAGRRTCGGQGAPWLTPALAQVAQPLAVGAGGRGSGRRPADRAAARGGAAQLAAPAARGGAADGAHAEPLGRRARAARRRVAALARRRCACPIRGKHRAARALQLARALLLRPRTLAYMQNQTVPSVSAMTSNDPERLRCMREQTALSDGCATGARALKQCACIGHGLAASPRRPRA